MGFGAKLKPAIWQPINHYEDSPTSRPTAEDQIPHKQTIVEQTLTSGKYISVFLILILKIYI